MNFAANCGGGIVAGAAAGGACLFFGFNYEIALAAGLAAWIGTLFPDFDITSIPQRWFGRIGAAVSALLIGFGSLLDDMRLVYASAGLGFIALLLMSFKHRGPTHKYWLPLILSGLAIFGTFPAEEVSPLLLAFSGGLCVHLCLDSIFPWSLKGWWLI
jgi:hypothetical protein